MNNDSKNNKPIHYYNRSQAIKEGVLFDVTGMTKSVGIKWHVAVTSAVWSNYIVWTDDDRRRQGLQDTTDRLWHIVFKLHLALQKADKHADAIFYDLDILPRDGVSYNIFVIISRQQHLTQLFQSFFQCFLGAADPKYS